MLTVWHCGHTLDGMKMTMHIDDELLARVMDATGTTSKTAAIDLALREMDRRAKLVKLASEGLGLGPDELKDAVDPAYDLDEMRRRETPVTYGRKPRSR
jgi:Arc/MetJ family transcription regulator